MKLISFMIVALLSALPVQAQTGDLLDAARQAYNAAWRASPLSVENGMLVDRPAALAGDMVPRASDRFEIGEPIYIYAEPTGYGYEDVDGRKEFGVVLDLEVIDTSGAVLLTQEAFDTIRLSSLSEVKEMFINLTVNLTGFTPGVFLLTVRIHDITSDETAEFVLPFEIVG